MKKNLTRKERLKKSSDIDCVFSRKQSVSCYGAKLFFAESSFQWNRMVCIPARGFKRAVDRNRARRHIKEIYRQEKSDLQMGYDLIFLVYPGVSFTYTERKQQIVSLLQRAELYRTQR